jgi:hypothetical protein
MAKQQQKIIPYMMNYSPENRHFPNKMSKDSGDFLFFWIRRIKFAYLFGQKTSGP